MQIHLLHVNDVHSQLENHMRLGRALRSLREQLRRQGHPVLTFDIGDTLDRVRPETEATCGAVNAALLAALQVDGWVFGNNEGLTIPITHWRDLAERANTVVFGTNLRLGSERLPGFADCQVYELSGVKVGVFGVTANYEQPYRVVGVDVLDPFACAARATAALRRQGCDLVVALSHLGLQADRELAVAVGGIDVILGGHSHHLMRVQERVGTTAIFQCGKHAVAFGHTVIRFDPVDRRVTHVESELVEIAPTVPYDQAMLSAYRGYLPDAEARLSNGVLALEQPLPVAFDSESAFANALAEILYRKFPCDLGMVNSGALTASLLPGCVEVRHIHGACSTPTRPVLLTLSGAAIRSIVEKSLQPAYYNRPGVGFGFRGAVVGRIALANAEADVQVDEEGRTRVCALRIGGQAVELGRAYRVATSEYLWLSAVFREFQEGADIEFRPPLMRELLLLHLGEPGLLESAARHRYRIQRAMP